MCKLNTKTTKSKRFSIVTISKFDFIGSFNEWYSKIPNVWKNFVTKLIRDGYIEVPNCTGGDEDYICIDHNKKEFIWCENGFWPFYIDDLNILEQDTSLQLCLTYLESIRK